MSPLREEISGSFLELGPRAPTILPGWDAAQLLTHLLLRERFPHLLLGRRLPGRLGRRSAEAVTRLEALPWHERVELLAGGPPRWSPAGLADRLTGDAELLIHHQDLLRAQPGWTERRARPQVQEQAWRTVGPMARVAMRVRTDVTLVSPSGGRRLTSRHGEGGLRVHGEPVDLLLWVTGRDEVARVRVRGDQAALEALREGRRGL